MDKKRFTNLLAALFCILFGVSSIDVVHAQPHKKLFPTQIEEASRYAQINNPEEKTAQNSLIWAKINSDGFGYIDNLWIGALTPFNNQLYASTYSYITVGQIWRLGSSGWEPITTNAFGKASKGFNDMVVYKGKLYAGSQNSTGGQLWRSDDGNAWIEVASAGFGAPQNGEIRSFQVFSDTLYATTVVGSSYAGGAEIWRSSTGDVGSWTQVVGNGSDWDFENEAIFSSAIYAGYYYVGTLNLTTGGEVWRSPDGANWGQVNADGFGDADNSRVVGLIEFNNALYASTEHNSGAGGEIWRCQICDNSDWVRVVDDGFGNGIRQFSGLAVFDGYLYSFPANGSTGFEIWRTMDGSIWNQVGFSGLGDSNNWAVRWDTSVAIFRDTLYLGAANTMTGAEVWYLPSEVLYLPLVIQ